MRALLRIRERVPLKSRAYRALDVALAVVALVIVLPLMALIAFLIVLDGPGPVFARYRQARPNGAPFNLVKFRTHRMEADFRLERTHQRSGDRLRHYSSRSRLGTVLWTTGIDELPSLINIVSGDLPVCGRYTWRQVLDWLKSTRP